MANFDLYAPTLKRLEGGFVNNSADTGGATNRGVTLTIFRAFFGKDKDVTDLKNMTDAQWKVIMKSYWDRCKGDEIKNQSVAEIIVDWHINSGYPPLKKVQGILGVKQDGIFGAKTLAAINGSDQECLHCRIKRARRAYYENIVNANPSQSVFLKGWLNRIETFKFK